MLKKICICLFFVFLLSGCSSKTICSVPDCTNKTNNGYELYCKEHTCEEDGCYERKYTTDNFCSTHEIQKEKEIMSSQESIEIAKTEVVEYCNLLKSEYSYINDIKIYETSHRIIGTNIVFDCDVIQTDTTKSASIYVRLRSDGSFEVEGLIYN